jgi:hypothetical protein
MADLLNDLDPPAKPPKEPEFPRLDRHQAKVLIDYLEWLRPQNCGRVRWTHEIFIERAAERHIVDVLISRIRNLDASEAL